MGVNVYEYLVNPYSLQGIKNITEVSKGEDFSIICDCTTEIFMVLYQMAQDHTTLVTVPGYACLYDILNICRKDSKVDIELKRTCHEMSDTFVQELIEVRCVGDYYKPKITAKRNDDGTVTFSVPTLQGLTLKQRVHPALSHGDEPGERGEQGGVDNEAVRFFSDVIGPFTFDSWQNPHSAIVKSLKTEKAIKFVDSWFAKKPPRKSLFILKEGSNDIFILTSVSIEAEEYGVITFEFSYYGNIMGHNVSFSIPTTVGERGSLPFQSGMLTYKVEDAMPKGEGKPLVVVDLFDELSVQGMFTKNDDDDAIRYIHIVRDEKLAKFNEKYRECTPTLRVRMARGLVYYILNERTNGINCEVWAVREMSIPDLIIFNEPKLVEKLCSSMDSAPTTRRINSVKLNKVTRL